MRVSKKKFDWTPDSTGGESRIGDIRRIVDPHSKLLCSRALGKNRIRESAGYLRMGGLREDGVIETLICSSDEIRWTDGTDRPGAYIHRIRPSSSSNSLGRWH
jgi:hypothetical protein